MPELAGFVAVALLIAVTPGADMALVARHVVAGGRRAGVIASLGILCGVIVHGLAAIGGLSAVVASSSAVYRVIKTIGAAYLIMLGVQTLWGLRGTVPRTEDDAAGNSSDSEGRRPFVEGLLTNVLNPKISILFLSLMPQFVNPTASVLPQIALLTVVFLAIGLAWLTFYVLLLQRFRSFFDNASVRRRFEFVVGVVLVAFGTQVLTRSDS